MLVFHQINSCIGESNFIDREKGKSPNECIVSYCEVMPNKV